jgi:pimeloyl-ACP methyl ester carboxylesterase
MRPVNRRKRLALFLAAVALVLPVPRLSAQQFTFLQSGFTQELFGTAPGFDGGVAFAPNGDVWVDHCFFNGSSLTRFLVGATTTINGTTVHPQAPGSPFASNAGCGLTNHPDGTLYSNTSLGVVNLDANTGAQLRVPFGPAGNALGITVDPQTNRIVYVAQNCRFTPTCTLISIDPVTTASTTFAVLNAADASFVDGIFFDITGNFLFISNRAPAFRMTILNRSGAVVQHVPMTSEPDGIAFHRTPTFVVTSNTDGTMTRFDFPSNDFTMAPAQTVFASGGFRGDLSQVGADGCLYATQDGTRFNNGVVSGDDSIVRICPNFAPPPGVNPQITGLRAIAGDGSVYLRWNPLSAPVDRFVVDVVVAEPVPGPPPLNAGSTPPFAPGVFLKVKSRLGQAFCEPRNTVSIGSVTDQDPSCLLTNLPNPLPSASPIPIDNGVTYAFGVRAEIGGLPQGPLPCPDPGSPLLLPSLGPCVGATASPLKSQIGQFKLPVPKPTHRLLFLHGFGGDGRLSGGLLEPVSGGLLDKPTFEDTLDFMNRTLEWSYGGELFHIGDSFFTEVSRGGCLPSNPTTCQPTNLNPVPVPCTDSGGCVNRNSDFFSASFADNTGGLQHQGDEVSAFVAKLTVDLAVRGMPPLPFTLVAHSNGGLAARDFITRFPGATSRIFGLVTYGTPHRGADLPGGPLFEKAAGILFDGARDARFTTPCTPTTGVSYPAMFLQNLSQKVLPDKIRYTAIMGVSQKNGILGIPFPNGNRKEDCHSAEWDGLVPRSSADLSQAGQSVVGGTLIPTITTNHTHFGQGNDFPAILCAIDSNCAFFRAMSPVDIAVIAPDGKAMARNFAAIPGASYMNIQESDGHESATVLIPFPTGGEYTVRVIPKPGSSPTDTFTLTFTQHGKTNIIAQDVRVEDAPAGGFRAPVASVTPFAAFSAKLEISADHPSDFEVKASFTLADVSNGIDPLRQELTLHIGTFSIKLPPGAFTQDKKGRFKFEGVIDGVELEAVIEPLGINSFEFKIEGQGANLAGIANPLLVKLTIGGDGGSKVVPAEFD